MTEYDENDDEVMDDDGGWPRCKTCQHMAQAHDAYVDDITVVCSGDEEGDTCDCRCYIMPEGWSVVDEKPVFAEQNNG